MSFSSLILIGCLLSFIGAHWQTWQTDSLQHLYETNKKRFLDFDIVDKHLVVSHQENYVWKFEMWTFTPFLFKWDCSLFNTLSNYFIPIMNPALSTTFTCVTTDGKFFSTMYKSGFTCSMNGDRTAGLRTWLSKTLRVRLADRWRDNVYRIYNSIRCV